MNLEVIYYHSLAFLAAYFPCKACVPKVREHARKLQPAVTFWYNDNGDIILERTKYQFPTVSSSSSGES